MNALTEYRRPPARLRAQAARAPWRPLGGWHRCEDGSWARVYSRGGRRVARRAVAFMAEGWWQWRVEEFDLTGRQVRRVAVRNRAGLGYYTAAAAWPFADLAARTAD